MRAPGQVLLLSTYELGHAPHHLASPLGFLERAGFRPAAIDLSVDPLDEAALGRARLVAIAAPMHTAVRLGIPIARRVRALAPGAMIAFYGLYAPLQSEALLGEGVADRLIGGEYEAALVALASEIEAGSGSRARPTSVVLERLDFALPARRSLPLVTRYAHLVEVEGNRPAGYAEATRGCLHMCRHCPIPPVYAGRLFVVPVETVLADIDGQVAAGARHITFGDPDFWNGPGHAMRVLRGLHERHPTLTFDVTIKVEHLLARGELLPELRALGCAFIISAVESLSDHVLAILDKGHTRADIERALDLADAAGVPLRPTLLPFSPASTFDDYVDLLDWIDRRDLMGRIDPIQMAIRLLVPPGSLLLALPDFRALLGDFDPATLSYRWTHPDPKMAALETRVFAAVEAGTAAELPAAALFAEIRRIVDELAGHPTAKAPAATRRPAAPRMSEPWFCCAEPSTRQLGALDKV